MNQTFQADIRCPFRLSINENFIDYLINANGYKKDIPTTNTEDTALIRMDLYLSIHSAIYDFLENKLCNDYDLFLSIIDSSNLLVPADSDDSDDE